MKTFAEYYRLRRESRKLLQEFEAAEAAQNEEAMGRIAFRQMDVDQEIERYMRVLSRQGVSINRRKAA